MEKRRGLKIRIGIMICALFALLGGILIGISYKVFNNTYIDFYYDKAQGIANMLAKEVDAAQITDWVKNGATDESYDEVLAHFNNVKSNTTELSYLYVFVPYEDHFVYVLDAYTSEEEMENIASFGDVFEYGEFEYEYLVPDIQAKKSTTEVVYGADVGYGSSISVWAPVLNEDGEVAAMVEADYVLSNLQNEITRYMGRVLVFLVLGLIIILIIVIRMMNKNVINPLVKLTGYVNSYENGELSAEPCKFKVEDEIKWLSDSFDSMIGRINEYVEDIARVTGEKERIGAELNVATQIQSSMLPSIFPAFPEHEEFDLYATMKPAKEVGGDFYDFFMVDERHLAVVMADVSGKGVPAALFMVIAKTLIKNHAQNGEQPSEVFENVNNQLCENNEVGMFVTAWMGIIDIYTGETEYVNAGHNYPVIVRKDGSVEWVKCQPCFILAGMEGMTYTQHQLKLEAGDSLYLYTDGISEALNESGELYGEERLEACMGKSGVSEKTPVELLDYVSEEVGKFVKDAEQADDMTMLAFVMKKTQEPDEEWSIWEGEAKKENLDEVFGFLEPYIQKTGLNDMQKSQILISVEEIYVNIASYAYADEVDAKENYGRVLVRCKAMEGNKLCLSFEDWGRSYNPLEKPDPDISLCAEERQIGGLGIFMVKQMMEVVEYSSDGTNNYLYLEKHV